MTISHSSLPQEMSPFVGPHSIESYYGELLDNSAASASAAYPSANRAIYVPFNCTQLCVMKRFYWLNGAVVSGTNGTRVGVYNDNDAGTDGPGTAVLLGTATTQAGTNVVQFDNITDTPLYPGRYWLAFWNNNTTSQFFRCSANAINGRVLGNYIEAAASGLQTTATPATVGGAGYIPVFGFTTIA